MIRNSKQNWTVGSTVRVGFLQLRVRAAVATPGDYLPDAYLLSNLAGTQLYKFVPHNGLEKVDPESARAMLQVEKMWEDAKRQHREEMVVRRSEIDGVFA
ncbi:MAG: hypothetical protein WAL34_03925 [Acidobacteriaceae bacterium]